MIQSISLCARVGLNLHNLNNEGTEGNQQQTRMVHILGENGQKCVVNAVSGDMFKHIFVEHVTPLLVDAGEPVCPNAAALHPDRILLDKDFLEEVKKADKAESIQDLMIKNCAVTDIAGTLYAEKAVARKSTVEFGWVVGIPEYTRTEQYFHVKYDPSRGSGTGTESVAGTQAIFHRPASSGLYALVSHLELYRIGQNDISRKSAIPDHNRRVRMRAAVQALVATLISPRGAQRNTQLPHITSAQGVITVSRTYIPAPTLSPLVDPYWDEIQAIVDRLNAIQDTADRLNENPRESREYGDRRRAIEIYVFNSASEALDILEDILKEI